MSLPSCITLRTVKGSVLSWAELDNNFICLNNSIENLSNSLLKNGNMWHIPSGYTLTLESDYQHFIYGDMVVEGLIQLSGDSQLVVLNGDLIFSGGSVVGTGTVYNIQLPDFDTKISGLTYNNDILTIYQNDGTSYSATVVTSTDVTVTGGTYDPVTGIATFYNNVGGNFPVTGFLTGYTDVQVNDLDFVGNTLVLSQTNGTTFSANTPMFSGNTSGDCITDLFVKNLNSCSPLRIQNVSSGDVYIGENGGVNVGIGTSTPTEKLEVSGNTKLSSLSNVFKISSYTALGMSQGVGAANVFIGGGVVTDGANGGGISIGSSSTTYGDGVSIGQTAKADSTGGDAIAIGRSSTANGSVRSVAIGRNATSSASNAWALGYNATASQDNSFIFGDSSDVNIKSGFGTNTPEARIHIKGSDSSTGFGLKVQNSGGTDNFVVRNDGKVGINTSNPNYQLEVLPKDLTGTTQVVIRNTSTSPNWTPVSLSVIDGSNYGVNMSTSGNGVDTVLSINSGAYSYLNHVVNGTTVAELLTSGNSLLWRLPDNFNFRRRATNGDWINFNSLNQRVSIGNENIGGVTIPSRLGLRGDTDTSSSYSLVIQNSGGTNSLVVRDDGNVGIGTSTPSEKLHVFGNTKITGTLNIGTIGSGSPLINLGLDSSGNVVTGTTGGGTFTGGTVTGPTNFTNGLTANTLTVGTFSVSRKFSSSESFTGSVTKTITHNLNTQDVIVQLWDSSNNLLNGATIVANNVNSVDITVSSTATYKVVIIG